MRRETLIKSLVLLACVLCSLNAVAAEAYANFTSSNTTLTFYYDDLRTSRAGKTYGMNTGENDPSWKSISPLVTQVVFDTSFVDARPTTTKGWFYKMAGLKSITGIEYLNTASVTSMQSMF